MTLALTSDSMPLHKVEDLADTRLAQKISQVSGVGLVYHQRRPEAGRSHSGESDRSSPPTASASKTCAPRSPPPTSTPPKATSTDAPGLQIDANDQLLTAADYKPLIIAYRNGAPVRMPM